MEAARDAAASGGCSIRDLPPSKRFKFVGAHLGSAPCLPLPAKKRAFRPLPEAAPVPVCLPAKKRAYAPAVPEKAAKFCLPAKKRAYALPVDDISPACLPAKTRVHVHRPPPEDAAHPPSVPSKKSFQAPARRQDFAAPRSVPAKKQVQMPSRLVADTAAPSLPAKKRVQVPSPLGLRHHAAPPTVTASKRVQAPLPTEEAAARATTSAKKRVQVHSPLDLGDAAAPHTGPVNKRAQPPSPMVEAAAPPTAQAKNRVQTSSSTEDAAAPPSVPAKQCVQDRAVDAPSVPVKQRVQATTAAPSVPAKQRDLVPSRPERAVAAPTVPAKQRILVPSRPDGAAVALSVTADKRVPSPSAPDDASALFPVCLPANKRVMSQFIPSSPSPSMKSDGDRVAAAKEARPERSVKRGGAINPAVANGGADCTRAEASKMPDRPNEVKDQVVTKSRRANTARKASDLHCKKLSDVINGMQSEVQVEVLNTFEQASAVHCKKFHNVVNGNHSEVQAEELKSSEQATDLNCKKLPNVVSGKHSEVQAEELKSSEQASDLHCKKLPNVVSGKHSEVQAEELKSSEQASDLHRKKLPSVVSGKYSEVQAEELTSFEQASDVHCKELSNAVNVKQSEVKDKVFKTLERAIDPKVAAQAAEEEPKKENEVAGEPKQDALVVEEDDGVLCAVCRSTDGDPSDPIVFCDGCDLMVHATCYGNPLAQSIPEGDWFCSLCSHKATAATAKKGKPARPPCRLCPGRGGAMKRTTDGAWAHIECALLVPEVFFQDPDGRDAIDCSLVPSRRFTKHCYLCESSRGCALECSQPKCDLAFHVSCGLNGGLCIEYREEKSGAIVAGFCREHTKIWEKQQLTGKYKIVSRGHA